MTVRTDGRGASGQREAGRKRLSRGVPGASHICDPAPVPGHRLGLQRRLLHPLTEGLKVVLGVQDEEARVLGGPLEEGDVRAQPPARGNKREYCYSGPRRQTFQLPKDI